VLPSLSLRSANDFNRYCHSLVSSQRLINLVTEVPFRKVLRPVPPDFCRGAINGSSLKTQVLTRSENVDFEHEVGYEGCGREGEEYGRREE
jgi:hypothetical protein